MKHTKTRGKAIPKPLPIEINVDEYVDLLNNTKFLRHKIAFMIAFESGLRISEVINLRKEDFDFKNKTIRVNMGKNSKDRIVNLPISWQDEHINHIPIKCGQRALQSALISSAKRTGLKSKKPKVHFHSLRHGHATECIRADVKLSCVQGQLGHNDLSTTAIYINLCPSERIEEVRAKFGRRA